ncbi:MAG: thioredoxin family protein [Bacteroidota bacterium]|jgi:peroxiredoxin
MAATSSKMLPLGTIAPEFKLTDAVSGKVYSLQDFRSNIATVIMFICNHCPYVQNINDELAAFANDFKRKGISFVGISSNDVSQYPEDSPELMKKVAEEIGYSFPYLYDETQEVARAYNAVCTPDFFIFDKDLKLVYHGQFDDSRPGNMMPVSGKDMQETLENMLSGMPVYPVQKPSIGCSIKWKE